MRPLLGFNKSLYQIDSFDKLYDIFSYIYNESADKNLVLYLTDYCSSLLFAELFKNQDTRKFIIVVPLNNFLREGNLQYLFNNNNISVVSDRNFSTLFNGEKGMAELGNIYLLNKDNLNESGFVSIFGVNIGNDWIISDTKNFRFNVNIPQNLYNIPTKLKVKVNTLKNVNDSKYSINCFKNIRLWLNGSPEPLFGEEGFFEIETSIPSELILNGNFSATVKLIESNEPNKKDLCNQTYILESIEVEEDNLLLENI
jgi:hypothetical protein